MSTLVAGLAIIGVVNKTTSFAAVELISALTYHLQQFPTLE